MYWQEDLNVAADKGRGIMITTVKFKMYADYEVREIVVCDVSGMFWAVGLCVWNPSSHAHSVHVLT